MPFTVASKDLPDHVKKLSDKKRSQWVEVWNSVFKKCQDAGDDGCEPKAFAAANGAVKESRGEGAGVGGAKQQDGGTSTCVCPECGATTEHERGVPCAEVKCPKCGATMAGANSEVDRLIDEAFVLEAERDTEPILPEMDAFYGLIGSESQTVTSIDKTIELLREQRVMKAEDGRKFSAAAYAYVPDSDKPSTWKLRLWESPDKKVTRRQLGAASAALSSGGFRGQKVKIPAGAVATVKAKIRAAYRSLGVVDKNIPQSVREAEPMERMLGREMMQVQEGAFNEAEGVLDVTIIRPGFNVSESRYYPRKMLARDKEVFEGLKMFADHPTEREGRERPERSVRHWVATTGKVTEGRDGELRTRAKIAAPWFKEQCALLKGQGLLKDLGVSIVALAEGVKTTVEGKKTRLIERLVKGRSVDFVTFAGAGGMVECFESENHPEDVNDIDLIDSNRFIKYRPDIVEIIESQMRDKLAEENGGMDELKKEVAELKESNETLEATNTELAKEVDAQKVTVAKAEVDKFISEAKLPDPTKARLTERFKGATSADGVKEAIDAESKYLDELKETGVVKELGGETKPITDAKESDAATANLHENMTARFKAEGQPQEMAESMADNFTKGM